MKVNTKKLYKLPFTKHDNPNGWIEPTTFCQLKCPHCYRGADQEGFKPAHRDIKDVLEEVDELIKIRNIQTLTIAGGEPLLYPDLDKLIKYAVDRGLNVMINTNGVALDKKKIEELKGYGVVRIVIHLDKYQGREKTKTEEGANKLREEYCNLFREVKGVELGFIMPISGENISDLEILLPFFKENADVIKLCAFTILCESSPDKSLPEQKNIDPENIFLSIKNIYGLEYCAYLGKTMSDDISWLFAYNIFSGKKFLGSLDAGVAKYIQNENYRREKRYLFVSKDNFSSIKFNLYKIINKSTCKIIIEYLRKGGRSCISEQIVLIVNTPNLDGNKWSLCDGCPDAILHEGNLVPSCFLERVKSGENFDIN